MIIDIHVHHRLGPEGRTDFEGLARLMCLARQVGIGRLCLLGNVFQFGVRAGPAQIRRINNATLALVGRHPEFLSGFCFMNPALEAGFQQEEIRRCARQGLSGVKLEIDVNARDKRLKTVMNAAADLNLPVLHHAWYKTVDKYPHESDPSDIADLARRFPENTIIMAHLVAAGIRGVLDIADCPNVCVDTSGAQPVAGMMEYAVAKLGADRVIFGSDACGRDFSCQLGKVLGARLGSNDRRKILHHNATRLLNLSKA